MGKLSEGIKEYFFGTATRLRYRRMRNFYREFHEDPQKAYDVFDLPAKVRNDLYKSHRSLDEKIWESRIDETVFLLIGKAMPNLIELVAIGAAIYDPNPKYLGWIAAAEAHRNICNRLLSIDKGADKLHREDNIRSNAIKEDIRKIRGEED